MKKLFVLSYCKACAKSFLRGEFFRFSREFFRVCVFFLGKLRSDFGKLRSDFKNQLVQSPFWNVVSSVFFAPVFVFVVLKVVYNNGFFWFA